MISIGKVPKLNFKVDAVIGGKTVSLPFSELLDGPTVVSVYMRNNTSACDKQAAELSKVMQVVAKKGFKLIAISRDKVGSHEKYAQKHGYKYALVADPDDLFSKSVDGMVEKSMYGKKFLGPARAAYVFDVKGRLVAAVPKVEAAAHGAQVLEAIASLK